MTFTVVGTPGERRVTLFADACRRAGLDAPAVVGWPDVLDGAPLDIAGGSLLRVESPGGDPAVDALLRGPGEPARVAGGAAFYTAFLAAVDRVVGAARRAGARSLNDPAEIAVLFDKRRCQARLAAAGVPVPGALPEVASYAGLRAAMESTGRRRVFVKPAHGSSASGVIALQTAPGGRIRAVTSAAWHGGELVNSLRVRTYATEAEVAAVVDALAPDGLHVEEWIPKASLGGGALDLRVVVVAGTATHAVVRTSRHPMTNLHLGGRRGDLDAVRAALGERGWRRALEVCEQAAACFPGSLMVGVDLLVQIGWRNVAVGEVNAFGDLLPGLPGLADGPAAGQDTYTAQIRAALDDRIPV